MVGPIVFTFFMLIQCQLDSKHEDFSIAGEWVVVDETNGNELLGAVVMFSSRRFSLKYTSGEIERFSFRISELESPILMRTKNVYAFDLDFKQHGSSPGIVQFTSDSRVTICLSDSVEASRPKRFKADSDLSNVVFTIERRSRRVMDSIDTGFQSEELPMTPKGGQL